MEMRNYVWFMLAAVSSNAAWAADFVDTARVIASTPIYERVSEPKQECWNETVSSSGYAPAPGAAPAGDRSLGGALLGGVIGGVLGSQVGQGHGNTAATAAGAIAGALIGDRAANPDNAPAQQVVQAPQTRVERHCRQIENYRDVIRGYTVTYRYNGHDVTVRMSSQPGETVRVGVSVMDGEVRR